MRRIGSRCGDCGKLAPDPAGKPALHSARAELTHGLSMEDCFFADRCAINVPVRCDGLTPIARRGAFDRQTLDLTLTRQLR